jgi:nucleotide-binding universal stress UspA family protein
MTPTFSILVASDLTEAGGYAFEQAARLAQRIPGATVHFLNVTSGDASEARVRQLGDQLRMYVSEKAVSMGGLQGLRVGVHVRHGDPMREIVQAAVELEIDLIVLGTPQHPHLKSLVVGTIAEKLLAHSPCPVVLAGPKPIEPLVHYPAIEPPCPDCVKARTQSGGREWWCTRHTTHGATAGAHVYSYQRELPFAQLDSAVIPTGIQF